MRREHAGRGIAAALMTEAERSARLRGVRRMELTVQGRKRAAAAICEKRGFVVEGTKKDLAHLARL